MGGPQIDDILAAIPLPMVLIGPGGRIATANRAGTALLGAGQIGRPHAIGLRQPALLSLIDRALHEGASGQAQYETITATGKTSHLVTVTALPDPDGHAALCAFQDMTEQTLIDSFRRDFVANVSHELRSPLTTLIGIIDTLKGAARDDPAAHARFLTSMQAEAERMARLVRDLLSLSKAEAEERRRPTAPVRIDAVAQEVTDRLRSTADAAGTDLTLILPDSVAAIPGDADQLAMVLQNLIENAIKYDNLGRQVRVVIDADTDDTMLRIDVIDRGEGIAPRHLPRLSERFYRVDRSRSRAQGGTGLGLAIVKHIVNRHRGRLAISSERGQGSRFSVLLPRS